MIFLDKGDSLSREDVPRLAKENEIKIKLRSFTDDDCEILTEVLRITTTLEVLDFVGNSVSALQNSKFIEALSKNHTIKLLDMENGTSYGVEGAKAIAAVLKENSTIENIGLWNNIGDEGVAALSEALKVNSTLQELYLD